MSMGGFLFFKLFHLIILMIKCIKADSIQYFCQARDGPADYTQHDLYDDGIRIENASYITFQVKKLLADSMNPNETARMRRLIWNHAGRKRLKSRENAYILLHQSRRDFRKYAVEIGLGVANNEALSIADKLSRRYSWCRSPGIISDSEYRYFWISWDSSNIRVGKGNKPNKHAFRCSEEFSCDINYISVATAYNSDGFWKFDRDQSTNDGVTSTSSALSTFSTVSTKFDNSTISKKTNEEEATDRTAISVSIPVTLISLVLILVILVIVLRKFREKSRMRHELNVVYENDRQGVKKEPTAAGIDNPVYINLGPGVNAEANAEAVKDSSPTESPAYMSFRLDGNEKTNGKSSEGTLPTESEYAEITSGKHTSTSSSKRNESVGKDTTEKVSVEHIYDHLQNQNATTSFDTSDTSHYSLARSPKVEETDITTSNSLTDVPSTENENTNPSIYSLSRPPKSDEMENDGTVCPNILERNSCCSDIENDHVPTDVKCEKQ